MNDEEKDIASIDGATSGLLDKIEQEIRNGYRTTEIEGKEYKIYLPSIKVDDELSNARSKLAAKLLRDGSLMTKDEVLVLLKQKGTWDESLQKKEDELRRRLGDSIRDIYLHKSVSSPNKDALDELRKERISVEMDLRMLTAHKDFFMNSTIESKIEEEVLKHKVVLCIKNMDGTPVFNSVDELENCTDKIFVNTITVEATYFWAGLDQSMFAPALD